MISLHEWQQGEYHSDLFDKLTRSSSSKNVSNDFLFNLNLNEAKEVDKGHRDFILVWNETAFTHGYIYCVNISMTEKELCVTSEFQTKFDISGSFFAAVLISVSYGYWFY